MKNFLLGLGLLLCGVVQAAAQCTGLGPATSVCGNPTGASAPPIQTTSPIVPIITGGNGTGSSLTLKSTTSGSPSGDTVNIGASNVNIEPTSLGSGSASLNIGVPATSTGQLVISSPTANAMTLVPATSATGTATIPNGTYTLVGNSTSQTLTNKTISTSSNTLTQATNAAQGVMEGDGVTITCIAGTCSAVGAVAASIDAGGATSISNGTSNAILYDNAGNVGKTGVTNNAVLVTNGSGVPSESTTLPSGLSATNMSLTTPTLGSATGTYLALNGQSLGPYAFAMAGGAYFNNNLTVAGTPILSGLVGSVGDKYLCFTFSGSTVSYSASGCNTSDERLKNVTAKITPAEGLHDVLTMEPVRFAWKDVEKAKDEGPQVGLLAQQVKTVIPELVTTYGDTTIKLPNGKTTVIHNTEGVSYEKVVVPLIAAVQELNARLEKLEHKHYAATHKRSHYAAR
jgi:hypothetical protein